jgi:hypothetical protein
MYFEDIYEKIRPLWKENYSLENIEDTATYVSSILQDYNGIEYLVDRDCSTNFSEWESMLVFTMYQVITAHSIRKWKEEKAKRIFVSEIPITLFEEYFKKNMEPEDEFEGNFEYLRQYKGLRNDKV